MKILFDHQIFEQQRIGGISRYFCEIMERLPRSGDVQVQLSLKYSQNEYLWHSSFREQLEEQPDLYRKFLGGLDFRGKFTFYKLFNRGRKPATLAELNRESSIQALRKQNFDVFHPTYFDDYFLPYIGKKPFVLTVYDMIHELFPGDFPSGDQVSERKRYLAKRASKIIAISEHTKQDLVRLFEISPEKIQVTHLANSMIDYSAANEQPIQLPERYVFFVGARFAYKNFLFFIHAMSSILHADPTLHVVCSGVPFTADEVELFARLGIVNRVHCRFVSDSGLGLLYEKALAFVFPSCYEGFGLPVLEAFSRGCPALLSNAGSLPEIGGSGANYFDPHDADSLKAAIVGVLYSESARTSLVDRGKERLRLFSWDETALRTEALYRDTCSIKRLI